MKIEIIKPCYFSGKNWTVGLKATVEAGLGKEQVDKGNAKSSDYVSIRDKFAESISSEKAVEILEELPRKAKQILKTIPTITNKPALEMLTTDGRSSVRDAAVKRLEEL